MCWWLCRLGRSLGRLKMSQEPQNEEIGLHSPQAPQAGYGPSAGKKRIFHILGLNRVSYFIRHAKEYNRKRENQGTRLPSEWRPSISEAQS